LIWKDDISTYKGAVICEMNRIHMLNMNHIPHFAQVAFPCWSILNQFSAAKKYIKLNKFELTDLSSKWITDLIQIFQDKGIGIVGYQNLVHAEEEEEEKDAYDGSFVKKESWTVSINKQSSGTFPRQLEDSRFVIENSKYFLKYDDVQELQRDVLGRDYIQRIQNTLPLRILLIDRAGGTREWIYSNDTSVQIKKIWQEDYIDVKIISSFDGTLHDQAMEIHKADIIISPHGAQLTNLVFIHPCTAVLELFPRNYYLGYFQPLVLSAGGISVDGYPSGRSPWLDTPEMIGEVTQRERIRKSPIHTSPASVVRALPNVISSIISCRRGKVSHLAS